MTQPQKQAKRGPRPRRSASAQVMGLFQASASLVAVLDPEELFVTLITRVVESLPAVQGGVLWIYDSKSGRLRASATAGLPIDSAARHGLLSSSLRSGEGMAGVAFQRSEPRIVETRLGYRDTVGHLPPASAAIIQQISDQLPRRLVCACIPLRVGAETIGVL
ncbi:MAG: histidine kinase, partial [Oscillochloris sp.]|nr:histidine kinase [Oscillochloris sp.]